MTDIRHYKGSTFTQYLAIVRWADLSGITNASGRYMLVWDWYLFETLRAAGVPPLTLRHKVAVVDDYGTLVVVGDVQY